LKIVHLKATQTQIRMIKQKTSVISLLSNKQCQYLPVQAWSSSALPKASWDSWTLQVWNWTLNTHSLVLTSERRW